MMKRPEQRMVLLKTVQTLFGIALALSASGFARSQAKPLEVERLFVPSSFVEEEPVFAVIEGYLPNTCLKLGTTQVDVVNDENRVEVTQMAVDDTTGDTACAQVLVPFTKRVEIGPLHEGKWLITTNRGALLDTFEVIKRSQTCRDGSQCVTAPVDTVRLVEPGDYGPEKAEIAWKLTNTCVSLERVEVWRDKETIEVSPHFELKEKEAFCEPLDYPYWRTVDLPKLAGRNRFLIRVRVGSQPDHAEVVNTSGSSAPPRP